MKLKLYLTKDIETGDSWLRIETKVGLHAAINLGCRDPKFLVQKAINQAIKEQEELDTPSLE